MNSNIRDYSNRGLSLLPPTPSETDTLYADNNSLTSLSALAQGLQVLSVSNNKISFLPELSEQCPFLKTLNLSNNKLVSINGLSNSVSIQELVLCNNFIGDEEILSLQNLLNLRFLDVSRNHLRSSDFIQMLKNFKLIEEVKCRNNEFERWEMKFSLEKLKTLDFEQNKISEISFERPLSALEKVLCKMNKVLKITGISNARNLKELDIGENYLRELPAGLDKTKVSVLLCCNNSISFLPFLPALEILDASNNSLVQVHSFGQHIQEVVLMNNHLKDLPPVPSAISINVSFNQIKSLSPFQLCRNLQNLDIRNNPLDPSEIVQYISDLPLRSLTISEMSNDLKNMLIQKIHSLAELNNEILPRQSLASEKGNFRSSQYWDTLSKSKIFPSCRSSLTGLTTQINAPTYNSIFSDIKPSLNNSRTQIYRYQNEKDEQTGRFLANITQVPEKENTKRSKYSELSFKDTDQSSRNKSSGRTRTIERKKCSKPNCKKHRTKGMNSSFIDRNRVENNTSFLVDQSTSPFVSRDFNTEVYLNSENSLRLPSSNRNNMSKRLSSNRDRTLNNLSFTKKNSLNQLSSNQENSFKKHQKSETYSPQNLSHLFTFAKTPPRPVLSHENDSPLTSSIPSTSYEFSLVKQLLFLEGYKLTSLCKTYTHSLQKSLALQSLSGKENNKNQKISFPYLLYYYNNEEVLRTIFSYNKAFEFLDSTLSFSLSISRTTSTLQPVNYILLCLIDPPSVSTTDGYIFTCSPQSKPVPVYLIQYS